MDDLERQKRRDEIELQMTRKEYAQATEDEQRETARKDAGIEDDMNVRGVNLDIPFFREIQKREKMTDLQFKNFMAEPVGSVNHRIELYEEFLKKDLGYKRDYSKYGKGQVKQPEVQMPKG